MKRKVIILLLVSTSCFSKFYSIKSEREFNHKVHAFDFSLVCFAKDNSAGSRIKDMMRNLAHEDYFSAKIDRRFAFLFVHADQPSLHDLTHNYNYDGVPLFVLLQKHRKIVSSTLGRHYSTEIMRNFINNAIGQELQDLMSEG